jgi:hypothetical protein
MSAAELEDFLRRYAGPHVGRRMFPGQSLYFDKAAKTIIGLATCRLKYLRTNRYVFVREFDKRYRKLPPWAQWRRYFNIQGCVLPGKKLRKTVPHKDRNGKWH